MRKKSLVMLGLAALIGLNPIANDGEVLAKTQLKTTVAKKPVPSKQEIMNYLVAYLKKNPFPNHKPEQLPYYLRNLVNDYIKKYSLPVVPSPKLPYPDQKELLNFLVDYIKKYPVPNDNPQKLPEYLYKLLLDLQGKYYPVSSK
ncbi:MAG TPA: hypothetical protein VEY70_08735 [Metabacillus sp.]|nr:hypothetical protein [Metabacillus sp.]